MVGKSTSGNWLMPMREAATTPKTIVAAISIQAKTGFRMQTSVMFMRRAPWPRATVGCRAGRLLPAPAAPLTMRRARRPQRLGAADDEHLAGLAAPPHLDPAVGGAHAQGQHALAGLAVLDDEGEEAPLARPDRRLRDDRRARALRRPGP